MKKSKHINLSQIASITLIPSIITLIICLITIVAASASIYEGQRDKNVISIDKSQKNTNYSNDSNFQTTQEETIDTYNATSENNSNSEFYMTADIFKTEYDNDTGQTVIKSINDENVIAPGASYDGNFTIKNTLDSACKTTYNFKCVYENVEKSPLLIKLQDNNGNYLIGGPGEDNYEDINRLNDISSIEKEFAPQESVFYSCPWKWEYFIDSETDKYDTSLGRAAASGVNVPKVTVSIEINAQPEPTPPAPEPQVEPVFTQTSDLIPLWIISAICIILIITSIVLKIKIKKSNNNIIK